MIKPIRAPKILEGDIKIPSGGVVTLRGIKSKILAFFAIFITKFFAEKRGVIFFLRQIVGISPLSP